MVDLHSRSGENYELDQDQDPNLPNKNKTSNSPTKDQRTNSPVKNQPPYPPAKNQLPNTTAKNADKIRYYDDARDPRRWDEIYDEDFYHKHAILQSITLDQSTR